MIGQEAQREEATAAMATRKPTCGKCGSHSVYPDNDPLTGARSIACRVCGNRYPGGPAPVLRTDVKTETKPP